MATAKKPIPLAVILVPLVAVLGLAGFMGFNLWRDYQKSEREDAEQQERDLADQRERTRKPKQPVAVAEEAPVDAGAAVVEDELGMMPKAGPKKNGAPAAKPASGNPAQRAFAGFKSAYDKLEAANETAVKKYRAQRLRLEDQYNDGKPANEARFIADCDALKAQILDALRNPENQ